MQILPQPMQKWKYVPALNLEHKSQPHLNINETYTGLILKIPLS